MKSGESRGVEYARPFPRRSAMNEILFTIHHVTVTPWKLVGYVGVFLFTARWFVQLYATKKLRRVHMPHVVLVAVDHRQRAAAQLFHVRQERFGRRLSNLFPAFVSVYNLVIDLRHRRDHALDRQANAS